VLQQLEHVSQQLLQQRRARRRCNKLGLQQQSQQLSQQPPQLLPQPPPQPPPLQPATGALATTAGAAVVVGAGSAPANHAVVTNKNAAFTRVILRWSLTSAEGRRDSAGSGLIRETWRPAPSSVLTTAKPPPSRRPRFADFCSFFRLARSPRLSSFPKNPLRVSSFGFGV